jgi:predicted nucleic acid-binding protein
MKYPKVILDTGPLVAYLNGKDKYHEWAVARFDSLNPPFLTCEAVLSEACFLLRHYENGVTNICRLLVRQLLAIPFRLEDELDSIKVLLSKYKNLPMSLADACLVRMAENIKDSVILTLDNDFRIYRKYKRKIIPTVLPDDP